MDAALKFQAGKDAFPFDEHNALLDAPQLRFVGAEDFRPPAPALGVHGVHPKQISREESRLLSAYPGPDLQNDISPVVGVPGEQQPFQLLPEALRLRFGGGQLFLGQGLQFRVPEESLRLRPAAFRRLQGPARLHHRNQLF